MKVIKFLIFAGILAFITVFVFSVVPLPVILIVGGLIAFVALNILRGYRKATKSMK